jgi:molybdate transport system substrate-binding protein
MDEMSGLTNAGLVDRAASGQVFASNRMVVILPPGNPGQVHRLEDLARPGVKLVLTAEQVPAGAYARRVLENLNGLYGESFDQSVLRNVVSNEENVRQAVSKVQLGEADAGIVYLSDAAAIPALQTLAIPDEMNETALYPIATVMSSPRKDTAAQFIEFVLSEKGRSVLRKWGFLPPAE